MSAPVVITCEDCGYATKPSTPTMAADSIRKHSCATQHERAARAQRNRLTLSGPEQPCAHNTHHPHGNRVRYVIDRCRCRRCRDANSTDNRRRVRDQMYGNPSYVDAGPARAHIEALTAAGMGLKRIVAVSDISQGQLWKLIYGKRRNGGTRTPSKRIRPGTEARILAITLDLAGGAKVDSTGTTRRIQALVAIGWSQSKIAARLGTTSANLLNLSHGRTGVTTARAKAVADLYDELWNTAPPRAGQRDKIAYSRSIRYAALAGWSVPMAWDEDAIDDPTAIPNLGERTHHPGGQRFSIEDLDFILNNDPMTLDQTAARFRVRRSAIEHACARAGRHDLLARMGRNKTVQEYVA